MISLNVYPRCNHVVSYNGYHNFMLLLLLLFSVVFEVVFSIPVQYQVMLFASVMYLVVSNCSVAN